VISVPSGASYRHTTFFSGVTMAMYCIRVNRMLPFDTIQTSSYSLRGAVEQQ
jgi:hypothetical protein